MSTILPPSSPTLLVDPDQQRQRLSELLDRMVALFEQSSVREAVGETALSRVRRERDSVMQRLRAPFTLIVLGDFKRGKSTLVNALVGAVVHESLRLNERRDEPANEWLDVTTDSNPLGPLVKGVDDARQPVGFGHAVIVGEHDDLGAR